MNGAEGTGERVLVLTRSGCCLCDEAIATVAAVCEELGIRWRAQDVDADVRLRDEWNDHVPVTFIDGERHDIWKVEEERLRAALTSPAR